MSIASRLTDLVDTLITALNARNAPGASDYQMWIAQGNTGTLADYRTAMLGGDFDWAGQFNTALGTAPAVTIATETSAGITQLATAAEVLAQSISTKGVSPANLGGVIAHYKVSSIAALQALSATAPDGTVARMANLSLGSGLSLDLSTWWKVGGGFYLVGENYATGATGAANLLNALMSAITGSPNVGIGGRAVVLIGGVPYLRNGSAWEPDIRYAHAYAMASASQAFPSGALTYLQTPNVLSNPTGVMAPSGGAYNQWSAPWIGRYRLNVEWAFTAAQPAGSYVGVGAVIDTGTGTSVADTGNGLGYTSQDGIQKSVEFWNPTINRPIYPAIYQNGPNTLNSLAPGQAGDPKLARVSLEYLGS